MPDLPIITKPGDATYVKCLIFGPPGHGKTRFLGTAQQDPRTSPMLLLDFEGGESTLSGLDIDMMSVRSWDDYSAVYNALENGDLEGYKSIGIDSISETQLYSLLKLLDDQTRERASKGQDVDSLQQADYGKSHMQIRRLLRRFRDLPYHIFMTSIPRDFVEPGEGMIKKPGLQGQMSEELVAMMDAVVYLALSALPSAEKTSQTKEYERVMLLKNYPKYRVKLRTSWDATGVPNEIRDPTVGKLLDLIGAKPKVLSGTQGATR